MEASYNVARQETDLVDGDSVHVGVVHEPDDLVGEEFSIVLGAEIRLSGL